MRIPVAALVLALVAGAVAPACSRAVPPAAGGGPTRGPAIDGNYLQTDKTRGGVEKVVPCFAGAGVFAFTTLPDGGVVMNRSWDRPPSGVYRRPEEFHYERTSGRWRGEELHLDGTEHTPHAPGDSGVSYMLTWDPDVRHLAGTRNGAPIRLAPALLKHPDCRGMSPPP